MADITGGYFGGEMPTIPKKEVRQTPAKEQTENKELEALKVQIEFLTKKIEELEKKNKELEQKVVWLDIHTEKYDPEMDYLAHN